MENDKRSSESPSPSPKKMKYLQRYNESWEKHAEYSFWLSRSKNGEEFAYCGICKRELLISNSGKTGIEKHAKGKKHLQRVAKIAEQSALLGINLGSMKCISPSSPEESASESSQTFVNYVDNDTHEDKDDASGVEPTRPKKRSRHRPYTVILNQAEESKPQASKTTVEALDKVANALQQVAVAIQSFSNWLPDQGS